VWAGDAGVGVKGGGRTNRGRGRACRTSAYQLQPKGVLVDSWCGRRLLSLAPGRCCHSWASLPVSLVGCKGAAWWPAAAAAAAQEHGVCDE
jgi:hypothetical protein